MWCWTCWRPRPTAPPIPRPRRQAGPSPRSRRPRSAAPSRRPSPRPWRNWRRKSRKAPAGGNQARRSQACRDQGRRRQAGRGQTCGARSRHSRGRRQAHRDGAIITFKNAGALPAAVFVRGLTAWIVLENAPNFDSHNLKTALGDFSPRQEAVSSDGLGILRITLKGAYEIAAREAGGNLQVEIGPHVAPAVTAIGFARNQSDPRRTSLSTLLPLADHAFPITDPAGGDVLTVIPAAPGRGVLAPRYFADFAALPQRQRPGDHALFRRPESGCLAGSRHHCAAVGPGLDAAPDAGGAVAFGAGALWRRPLLSGFRPLGRGLGRQFPRHRTPPHPGGGQARRGTGGHGAADPGALLSCQRLCRRGAGADQPAAVGRSGAVGRHPAHHHARGGGIYDGPLSRRP